MTCLRALLLATLAATAQAAPLATGQPAVGSFGFDLAGMDRTVKPGDDFTAYASGTWAKHTTIPGDHPF